jgi:hypothetical protein
MIKTARPTYELCLLSEAGVLERQALLLIESLRRFGGSYADMEVTVVSPRPTRRPSDATVRSFEKLSATYLPLDIHSPEPDYGPSFRVLALSAVAQNSKSDIIIQTDSDTVFCDEPEFDIPPQSFAARPVDLKGVCSSGPGDPFEEIWQRISESCGVDLDKVPFVVPTLGHGPVRASYNGGLIIAQRDSGFWETVEELFIKILLDDLRPYAGHKLAINSGAGLVEGRAAQFWGTSQIALTMAAICLALEAHILSPSHNIPIHISQSSVSKPRHIHYHQVLSQPDTLQHFWHSAFCASLSADFRSFLALHTLD